PLHLAHLSTAATCEVLRDWRPGPTAETAPHYLALTCEAVAEHGANAKMNPPLRTEQDRQALLAALRDRTITAIATDHAPHTAGEKAAGLLDAPFGIVGLETALAVVLTEVVDAAGVNERIALGCLTHGPADALGIEAGRLMVGGPADLTVVDTEARWTVDPERFASLGRNTPFAGMQLRGQVDTVIAGGQVAVRGGRPAERPELE
ncbi:MAG TPA: amidohydrolase family protein, partial [Armatimonadota bacterium]|nr:amidohydrolase family protein [Armatimonadota bacterium]